MKNADSPASPVSGHEKGLTKREIFAMAAMQGILANKYNGTILADAIAKIAIETSDALLTELEKQKK